MELFQNLYGKPNKLCSTSDFLAHTQGGGSEWHRLPRRPEGQYQLEVFFCRSGAGASSYLPAPPRVSVLQQKVADCIEWIDEAKLSKYKKVVDLVQFWAPMTTATGGGDERILSVSGQPFGIGRQLSDGVCQYLYDCIWFIQKPCRDDGDPISAAFETSLVRSQHQLVDHHYGVQSRWALPVLEPPTGKCIGVLELVTMNDHRFEYHKLLTQTFLEFGPIYYEDNGQHFPMKENMIPVERIEQVPLFNDPTIWGGTEDEQVDQVPTEEYMGGTNLSYGTILNVSCGNASEDHSRIVPYDQIGMISNLVDDQIFNDPTIWGGTEDEQVQVLTQEYMGATNDQIHETLGISLSCGTMNVSCGPLEINAIEDPRIVSYDEEDHTNSASLFDDSWIEELLQVPVQENMGGTNGQIETPGMIQQLSSKSPYNDNSAVQRTSASPTCRNRRRLTRDQLLASSGKRQKDVADEVGVHPSTIRSWCRGCGIEKWPSRKTRNKKSQTDQYLDTMSVKATYGTCTVKFNIHSTIEFAFLCKELGEMFQLDVGTFTIDYREVDTGNLIMISCTQELKRRLDSLNSSEKKTMHLMVSQAN